MTTLTGVEIGPDSCVVICAQPLRGGELALSFAHRLEFPKSALRDGRLAHTLRDLRSSAGLPRTLCGVSWNRDADHQILTAAGFEVRSILSPPEALALLAPRHRPAAGDGGVAWLAVNRDRAAFAIVSGARLLFARTFDWTVGQAPLPSSAHAALLRRYLYVSQLAPELQHAIDTVRALYGIHVKSAVTCGDMTDLRSLAMPLAEELDVEVDTLDSTVGLTVSRDMGRLLVLDAAPALRLACAALSAPHSARAIGSPRAMRTAAALFSLTVLASAGWTGWSNRAIAASMPVSPPTTYGLTVPSRHLEPASFQRVITPDVPSGSSQTGRRAGGTNLKGQVTGTTGSIVPRAQAEPSVTPDRSVQPLTPRSSYWAADAVVAPRLAHRTNPPKVDLILSGNGRDIALVDGRFVEVGEETGAWEVVAIEPDGITLRDRQGTLTRIAPASDGARSPQRGRGTGGQIQP